MYIPLLSSNLKT